MARPRPRFALGVPHVPHVDRVERVALVWHAPELAKDVGAVRNLCENTFSLSISKHKASPEVKSCWIKHLKR